MEVMRRMRPGTIARAVGWLTGAALCGIALALLYRDAEQQDAGYHYLFARWAWREPYLLVDVWGRPLFTLIYSIPAQLGYLGAKLFTVALGVATGWQTWRLALELRLERAQLVIPLLFLQPAYFALFSATYTEPLFAFLLVVALRLHLMNRVVGGMLVASLLILVRPEGFFVGLLWGLAVLLDRREGWAMWQRLLGTVLLASGALLWWGAAWLITGDPRWILHNWPQDWNPGSAANGHGPWWWYFALLPLIVGPLFLPQFLAGLRLLLIRRHFLVGVAVFLLLFVLHSVLFVGGWFGAAGYARYLVCVSPVIAIITLAGWREIAWLRAREREVMVLALSLVVCAIYFDGVRLGREARAIDEMAGWFEMNARPVSRFVFSQSYMCIRLSCDGQNRVTLTHDRAANLDTLGDLPPETLVFWDAEVGPKWYRLAASDFAALGFTRLRSESYTLHGWLLRFNWRHFGGPRRQELHLFYKERESPE